MSYYNVKVNVTIDGKTKPELYLVDAESCTEAEAKIYKDFEGFTEDWEVVATVKTKIAKVI